MEKALEKFGSGATSALDAADDAFTTVVDGGGGPATRRLAQCGAGGEGNAERNLHAAVAKGLPGFDINTYMDFYYIDLPFQDETGLGVVFRQHPIFLPHEWLAALCTCGMLQFILLGPGGAAELREYWDTCAHLPWCRNHPAWEYGAAAMAFMLPFGLHGDDVGTTQEGKILVLSLNGVLCRLGSHLSRLLLALLSYSDIVDLLTLRELYLVIAWSCRFALLGIHPCFDHLGREFPLGSWRRKMAGKPLTPAHWRLAYVETRGDWKFRKETYLLKEGYNTNCVCERCNASKKNIVALANNTRNFVRVLFTIFLGAHSGWFLTMRSHAEFMQSFSFMWRPGLCYIPGWHASTMRLDIVHNINLGILPLAIASALIELLCLGVFGPIMYGLAALARLAFMNFKAFLTRTGMSCSQKMFTPKTLRRKGSLKIC